MRYRIVFPLLVCFSVFSFIPFASAGPRDTKTSEIVEKVMPSIARIATPRAGVMDVIGSGFVIDSRGYILTNQHVVDGEKELYIGLTDNLWVLGEIIFNDEGNDLAVLKIDAKKPLPELRLGPSSDLKVGEPAISVGNPLDEAFTVNQGIISKLQVLNEREVTDPSSFFGGKVKVKRYLIQTDAAINPGNSGGPLFNANGEVIGVNELRKGFNGLGWAIGADRAARVLAKGLRAKKLAGVEHGITEFELKVTAREGEDRQAVLVKKLEEEGAAKKADIQVGDRIVKIDGKLVINAFDVERSLWDKKPGDQVIVNINRGGAELPLTITLTGDGIEPEIKD